MTDSNSGPYEMAEVWYVLNVDDDRMQNYFLTEEEAKDCVARSSRTDIYVSRGTYSVPFMNKAYRDFIRGKRKSVENHP